VQRPRSIAEVALDLAQDGRRRIRHEARLARHVKAVDRLHDPDARDLDQIVYRFAAARIANGQRARQRQHLLGQLRTRRQIAILVVTPQEHLLVNGAGHSGDALHPITIRPARHAAAQTARPSLACGSPTGAANGRSPLTRPAD
jgi:hypothetical protein